MYANMRDINPEALTKRVQRFDKKKVGQDNTDNIHNYKYGVNETNLPLTLE